MTLLCLLVTLLKENNKNRQKLSWILTFEGNSTLCKARVFCFPEAQQGGGEERVINEILHVVALAFLFGFSAHLIRHILPAGEKWQKYAGPSHIRQYTDHGCLP